MISKRSSKIKMDAYKQEEILTDKRRFSQMIVDKESFMKKEDSYRLS